MVATYLSFNTEDLKDSQISRKLASVESLYWINSILTVAWQSERLFSGKCKKIGAVNSRDRGVQTLPPPSSPRLPSAPIHSMLDRCF